MDPASPDARLSNYRLERLLGQGGMGAVYLARDLALDRPVAIKFIAPDRAADPVARQRLLREARAAAALDHPNICVIHEVIDEPGGRACIVMQYVEGEALASRLRSGPLEVRLALSIAAEMASALSVAHKRGIIHRDIKPQNIVLTEDNHAKLLDFGLALQQLPIGSENDSTETVLTTPGALAGTPAYMSPEQAQGQPLDGRSDLFSLGCVLYECLTGRRPFKGSTPYETAHQVLSTDPPAPSSVRTELSAHHDELCLRLLAKHRDDRFQSADELLGALRVSTSGTHWSKPGLRDLSALRRHKARWGAAVGAFTVILATVGFVAWRNLTPPSTPVDPQAAEWYRRGTESIRDGAPHSARLALTETIKVAPDFVPAYIRLAEAETELDESERAQETLLRAGALVSGMALAREDRTRVDAVRGLMLRDPDVALKAYRQIAEQRRNSPDVWLDLGRAQDAFSQATDARLSFEKAIEIDDQYAAAHLRRASILAQEGRRTEALAGFDEAERLYRAASRPEGEVETLLRRGAFLNGAGQLEAARQALERAASLAGPVNSRAQQIRAQLILSTVTAAEGKWTDAENMAQEAVADALRNHLELVAADGLVDLATVMIQRGKLVEANGHLERSIELAEERRAYRILARAKLQQAFLMSTSGKPGDAIAAARWPLEFFRTKRYKGHELTALAIVSRAHEALRQYAEAKKLAEQALEVADAIGDEAQAAEALENLGGQANALGDLPAAAGFRARGLDIHRRQKDASRLGFDLVNRADLLIRLGRHADATPLLDEIDAGVASGLEAYAPRKRRADTFRLISAGIQRQPTEIRRYGQALVQTGASPADYASQVSGTLLRYADALEGKALRPSKAKTELAGSVTSPLGRELRYWELTGLLQAGDPSALSGAEETLAAVGKSGPAEFEWRIASIGAAAARQLRETEKASTLGARAQTTFARLRAEWKQDIQTYEARPDLVELRRKAGFQQR